MTVADGLTLDTIAVERTGPNDSVSVGLDRWHAFRAVGIGAGVLIVGLFVPSVVTSDYYMGIFVDGLILGLLALSIGFLAHRSGLLSLGHTAFFGGAGYLVAIATIRFGWSPLTASIFALLAATVLAALIGALVVRTPGMSFVMLTLAFGQALYVLSVQDSVRSVTGAYDGLSVQFSSTDTVFGLDQVGLGQASTFWPVAWTVAVLVGLGLWLVERSRLGTVLEAIRENEERARFNGYNTYVPRLIAFTISGAAAAVAGILFALHASFVSPDVLSFVTAGYSLIATIVGGLAYVVGPVLGGGLYIYAQNQFSSSGDLQLYTGIALIVVLVFLPGGVVGTLVRGARMVQGVWRRSR